MEDNQFIFYRSFYDSLKQMKPAERNKALKALLEFAFDDIEPGRLGPQADVFMTMAMPFIRGRRRGAPDGNCNNPYGRRGKPDPEPDHENPDPEPESNKNNSGNKSENQKKELSKIKNNKLKEKEEKEIKSVCVNARAHTHTHARDFNFFRIPPDPAEVAEYARQFGISDEEVYRFVTHYSANGWMMGKTKIVNWAAALAKWTTNGKK